MPILMLSLQRTRAEPGPYVATVRRIEVSIGVVNEARTSDPATAAQDLMSPKPRFRVFFVWTRYEAGIGLEVTRRPFPHVSDHLAAAVRAITCRQRSNVETTHFMPVKIG